MPDVAFIPASIVAGDSLTFMVTDPEFPASTSTLYFALSSATANFSLAAAPVSRASFIVTVAGTSTAGFTPGKYSGFLVFTGPTGARKTKHIGFLEVTPNPLAGSPSLTWAQQALAATEAAILGISAGTMVSASISGQSYTKRNLTELMNHRDRLQAQVDADLRALGLPSRGGSKTIVTRFR